MLFLFFRFLNDAQLKIVSTAWQKKVLQLIVIYRHSTQQALGLSIYFTFQILSKIYQNSISMNLHKAISFQKAIQESFVKNSGKTSFFKLLKSIYKIKQTSKLILSVNQTLFHLSFEAWKIPLRPAILSGIISKISF